MNKFYNDYLWKNGTPYGINPVTELEAKPCYKIVMDPYRKRISIEFYSENKNFKNVIYDSALINFRKLSLEAQSRWQRTVIIEEENTLETLIRDEDDRILYKESAIFRDNLCCECKIESPHGIYLACQRIYYTQFGDAFNGVILFDALDKPVMKKQYLFDATEQQFGDLLEECWELPVA